VTSALGGNGAHYSPCKSAGFRFRPKLFRRSRQSAQMTKRRLRTAPEQPETPSKPRRGGEKKRKRCAKARLQRVSREQTQLELALSACASRPPRKTGRVRRPRVTYREVAQELWGVDVARNVSKVRRLMKKHGLQLPETRLPRVRVRDAPWCGYGNGRQAHTQCFYHKH